MADDDLDQPGTTDAAEPAAPEPLAAEGTGASDAGTTTPERSFFDPSALPPELKTQWSKMHRAYTKALEKARERQPDLELVDRYRSDPAFAQAFLIQEAQRLGLSIASPAAANGPASPGTTGTSGGAPPDSLVTAIRSRLTPELQWMAEPLAAAQWEAQRTLLAPLHQRMQEDRYTSRAQQVEALADELGQQAPGWEQYEDDMTAMLDFFQSDRLHDKRFGSKLDLLYRLVAPDGAQTARAIQRMGEAARSRSSTGQSSRASTPNTTDRVLKAKSANDAFRIAAEEAARALKAQGVEVPE